MKGTKTFELMH